MGHELFKAERDRPFGEIEKFQPWVQYCIQKYLTTGNLDQVFQVSHAAVIFESLWSLGVAPSDDWLLKVGKSALFALEKINTTQTQEKRSELEDELLAITLLIREYFIINDCFDPNSGLVEVGKIWKQPEHPPKYYLDKLHRIVETFS